MRENEIGWRWCRQTLVSILLSERYFFLSVAGLDCVLYYYLWCWSVFVVRAKAFSVQQCFGVRFPIDTNVNYHWPNTRSAPLELYLPYLEANCGAEGSNSLISPSRSCNKFHYWEIVLLDCIGCPCEEGNLDVCISILLLYIYTMFMSEELAGRKICSVMQA